MAEQGKNNPSQAVETLERITRICQEIQELRKTDDDTDVDDDGYKTADEVDNREAEIEYKSQAAAATVLHHMAPLGMPKDSAEALATALAADFCHQGLFALEIVIPEDCLATLVSSDDFWAFVDTCGSKCFIKDQSLCKPGTVCKLRTPIKVVMGKSHTHATHMGMLEFMFTSNNTNNVILLPTLICPEFDQPIVILSGPMLNMIDVGLGPTTNYLISLSHLRDNATVPLVPTAADDTIPIEKKSNGMPYVNFHTSSDGTAQTVDFVTKEPYSYTTALKRLHRAFPELFAQAAKPNTDSDELKTTIELFSLVQQLVDAATASPQSPPKSAAPSDPRLPPPTTTDPTPATPMPNSSEAASESMATGVRQRTSPSSRELRRELSATRQDVRTTASSLAVDRRQRLQLDRAKGLPSGLRDKVDEHRNKIDEQ